jgi:LmbE family N-acetylglucosaminyl deacetylase
MVDGKVFLVLSPHFDDAVLSVGAWLSRHPGTTVATVCSGLPGEGISAHGWDAGSGFSSGNDATLGRRREDANALATLKAEQRMLGFLDGPYRTHGKYHESESGHTAMYEALVQAITHLLEEIQPDRLLFPLGWGHDDHRITSDAAVTVVREVGTPAIAYAELPYAVADPAFAAIRIGQLQDAGLKVIDYPTPTGDLDLKRMAWNCYPSQHIHLDTSGCFSPSSERLYRIQA